LALKDVARLGKFIAEAPAQVEFNYGFGPVLKANLQIPQAQESIKFSQKFVTAGRWMTGIGGALMIVAAVLKGVQIYEYYHRTFTQIPNMIVDETDIVSYTTNDEGKEVKIITFDQFAYYEVVKCNRQEIGIHTNAQDGVSQKEILAGVRSAVDASDAVRSANSDVLRLCRKVM